MTREEISKLAVYSSRQAKCVVLELPTGYGKTKTAIDIVKSYNKPLSILLIVAQTVHKKNWAEEIDKWGGLFECDIKCDCYNSLKKHQDKEYDIVILDEGHHLSEDRKMSLQTIKINLNLIVLSATLTIEMKRWFNDNYETKVIRETLVSAIEDNILPAPEIQLFPLKLKDNGLTELYIKNPKQKKVLKVSYEDLKKVIYKKDVRIECEMTKTQYLKQITEDVEAYKRFTMQGNAWAKNTWLKKAGDRLKWLAEQKEDVVLNILKHLKGQRVLTFCTSVDQTERLGSNAINSKRGDNQTVIDSFNKGEINHITACDVLNEGVNLYNCRYGILVRLNSSERIVTQRLGRILRHKEPIIIIPYFVGTREEEIVNKITEGYDPELIRVFNLKH